VRLVRAAKGCAAFALIVAGVALWSVPAALVTAGVLLIIELST
jgi:hypothetical protein